MTTKAARPTFAEACARYTNRYTAQHIPAWALKPCEGNGKFYAPQFATDAQWYENTKFYGDSGFVGSRNDCYTNNQTWPYGQWLDRAFSGDGRPAAANTVAPGATEEVNYFCLAAWKGAVKLESHGMKSSGGAIRPRIAARLGLKPRASYEVFIERIQSLMNEILAAREAEQAELLKSCAS